MGDGVTYVRLEKKDQYAEIVLCYGKQLNTMHEEFFRQFHDCVKRADEDEDVRVLLVRAEGRHFTAGLDLKKLGSGGSVGGGEELPTYSRNMTTYQLIRRWQDCFSAMEISPKPVIVAIHGKCIGGGIDLITAADIRLCTADAQFAIQETKVGFVADLGTLQRIQRVVGKGIARELVFTGKTINAERANAIGLVNLVCQDKDDLDAKALAMVKEILANSPRAVQGAKISLNYAADHTVEDGLEQVRAWNTSFVCKEDLMEAVRAFMMKETPTFAARL
mmetsp:Transcript_28310/g.79158  ORF Transcript_28310/g.79158 Transcript_28310/m.79158 type:complete len:277 (+) Transcript_28310:156-986(+)|eukprot:CAMPEP_0119146272 /NCGR_PEP_ID=MMETSP1310-20130426/38646_1 /TAXON_ID=464262 /ORGANISM="Genus nov. species nov., Strain RCC2339" /LENGTH=276 /DNA_ID=CAMNT_0007138147 /DNA_START=153 /DNA_END=983 /DNA_ORIENTATION=-